MKNVAGGPGVQGRFWQNSLVIRGAFLAKIVPQRCLFGDPENRTGHPKTICYKSSALGPSKNVLREHFFQETMKIQLKN